MCTCKVTGTKVCHCAGCHETFGSLSSFDWHQRLFLPYGIVCLAPELIRRKDGSQVLFRDRRGYWREHRPDLPEVGSVLKGRGRRLGGAGAGGQVLGGPSGVGEEEVPLEGADSPAGGV